MAASLIANSFKNLFNYCIVSATYLKALKSAEVIPIFKSGNKKMCVNYRPISLLTPFSKIFETCLYKQIYSFFTSNNLFCKFQCGFSEKMSTEMAVAEVCYHIIANFENEQITCTAFLDLQKISTNFLSI